MALDASLLGVLFKLMSFCGFELEAAFAHYGQLGVWSHPLIRVTFHRMAWPA